MASNRKFPQKIDLSELEPASTANLDFLVPKKSHQERMEYAESLIRPIPPPRYSYRKTPISARSIEKAANGMGGISTSDAGEKAWLRESIFRCLGDFEKLQEELRRGFLPANLKKHATALKLALEAEKGLKKAQDSGVALRVPKQRLRRSNTRLRQFYANLTQESRQEIDRAAAALTPDFPASPAGQLKAVRFLLDSLVSQSVAEHREDPRKKLKRDLALVFWRFDPASGRLDPKSSLLPDKICWRRSVHICMRDAGLTCIDPIDYPGRFDAAIGRRWIATFLHPVGEELSSATL